MPPQSFANSYILTTRDQPQATSKSQTFPLPNGALWWYTAPKQYDPEVTDYTAVGLQPSASPPPAFLTMLAMSQPAPRPAPSSLTLGSW
jgi:hypothetical protein